MQIIFTYVHSMLYSSKSYSSWNDWLINFWRNWINQPEPLRHSVCSVRSFVWFWFCRLLGFWVRLLNQLFWFRPTSPRMVVSVYMSIICNLVYLYGGGGVSIVGDGMMINYHSYTSHHHSLQARQKHQKETRRVCLLSRQEWRYLLLTTQSQICLTWSRYGIDSGANFKFGTKCCFIL